MIFHKKPAGSSRMFKCVFVFWFCVLVCVSVSNLLGVCVKGHRHVEQQLPVFNTADEVLYSDLQVSGCLVDLFWVALSGLSQLLGRLQQLVSVGVCVLKEEDETFIIIPIRLSTFP